jgi:hypothetical protein
MTTLTARRSNIEDPVRGELTLGERLAGAWEELRDHGAAACPVCGDRLRPAGDAGRCEGCCSELR